LGEMDAAFEWLDRAYEERSGWLPYVGAEPRLAPLRQDARFARLLDRIGLNRNHADLPPYERYSGRE
jgi:hypothetical protein